MFAKKLLTAVLVLGVISGTVYAADQFFENKDSKKTTIMFADSVLENGRYDKSDAWLTGSIKTSLLSSLKKYGGFNCIDLDEQKNVAVVQKKLSSSIYDDEDSSFEIGKLVKAKNIVNVKSVRMQSGAYRLSVTMLNVETGEVIGVVSLNQGYESAEIFAASAPIDAMPEVLKEFNVVLTSAGKSELKKETEKAHSEIIRLREIAEKNLAAERESDNVKLELLKLEREKEERRAVEEAEKNRKAEQAAAQKALEEKKAKEAAARATAKKRNPFNGCVYQTTIQNGSRNDTYKLTFTSSNEVSVIVTSVDASGNTNTVKGNGNYSYSEDLLSIKINTPNQNIKYLQAVNWTGVVSFTGGYKTFNMLVPVNSFNGAKKVNAEFFEK